MQRFLTTIVPLVLSIFATASPLLAQVSSGGLPRLAGGGR